MTVLTAGTGREAIATLESTPDVAIVLMDIMMPEMDGYETMQVIRQNRCLPAAADHRAYGEGHEGRSRESAWKQEHRSIWQSRSIRSNCFPPCECGCIGRCRSECKSQQLTEY